MLVLSFVKVGDRKKSVGSSLKISLCDELVNICLSHIPSFSFVALSVFMLCVFHICFLAAFKFLCMCVCLLCFPPLFDSKGMYVCAFNLFLFSQTLIFCCLLHTFSLFFTFFHVCTLSSLSFCLYDSLLLL